MSQKSGIALKQNFQIDIHNGNILIYIHNLNYDPDKILLAVDIIDNLSERIKIINDNNNNINNISNDVLQIINEQYQNFITKREIIITQINDNSKKLISSIKDLELTELNLLLSNKYSTSKTTAINLPTLTCSYCNSFTCNNEKSFTNHTRQCKKKIIVNKNETNIIENNGNIINNETIEKNEIETIINNETINNNIVEQDIKKKSNKKTKII